MPIFPSFIFDREQREPKVLKVFAIKKMLQLEQKNFLMER